MPSGIRMPVDMAFMDTVMQRFPPALSPARQTRSAVEPDNKNKNNFHNNSLGPWLQIQMCCCDIFKL